MKGALKTVRTPDNLYKKSNFNDWCDPKCKPLRKKQNTSIKQEEHRDEPKQTVPQKTSQTSEEIEDLRRKIKEGYVLLSQKEIRNLKLPFYESLLQNLKEDGFISTCEFIKDLIVLDEEFHKQGDIDSIAKNRPFLKSNIPALNSLCKGLTIAELSKKEGNATKEIQSFLSMAIYFSRAENESWYWLAEELFEQCVTVSNTNNELNSSDQQLEAIAKHIFATFILDVLHDPKRAQPYVEESMQLSIGKNWNISQVTGNKNDILYFESCLLLHKIFLEMAHLKADCEIDEAIQLCRSSLHWAKQINCKAAEAKALINLVDIYIAAGQLNPVLGHIESYMKLCNETDDVKGLCDGYVYLATYHDLINQNNLVIEDIKNLLAIAEENKIVEMMAMGHSKLATFYLLQGKQKEMKQHAVKAYSYYVNLGSRLEMEETRCLTGIAQAHEIMSQYIDVLSEAENLDIVEFRILILWKTLRIPFFYNVKLHQPEAETNLQLKDRIETMKNDEFLMAYKIRQAETVSAASGTLSKFTMKSQQLQSLSSISSRVSKNVMNVQKHKRSTVVDTEP